MLDTEGIGNPYNPRATRRAGLVQRIQNKLGFKVEGSDNPDVDYGFSRNERIVLGIAVVSLAAATVLGINYKEDRVQENYDRNVPEHVDSDSNSGQ